MRERDLIARLLAPVATHSAARGLADDAAVLTPPLGRDLVFTHDMLAEGVHYLRGDPPDSIAHKLVAVNLSDLAAMGARPLGVLLGLGLSAREDEAWLTTFTAGLAQACTQWNAPLIGGDTIAGLDRAVLGLTAIGQVASGKALSRSGARAGDDLWVTGNIGDAALGLAAAQAGEGDSALIERYRRPEPRLAFGTALVALATACMDVSDGLLIDAERIAQASGAAIIVELADVPISRAAEKARANRLALATGGDDYELLFTALPERAGEIAAVAKRLQTRATRIGTVREGRGLTLLGADRIAIVPDRLGWEH